MIKLKPTQWMAVALKLAMDLPREQRDKKLNIWLTLWRTLPISSLKMLEICHAVVLTTMEADKKRLI